MIRTRFGNLIVLACMGALAACTSGGGTDTAAGNTNINLTIAHDPASAQAFDADRVDYVIDCDGNGTGTADTPGGEDIPDATTFSGQFEIVDTRTPPVWQAVRDLPPGMCTITLSVSDTDEVVCTGTQMLPIEADKQQKYNIELVCDLSIQSPVGTAEVDGTFRFVTGNFCPSLYVFNAIPSVHLIDGDGISDLQVRALDFDDGCNKSCDPDPPGRDPGRVVTSVTCDGGILTGGSGDGSDADNYVLDCNGQVGDIICTVDATDGDTDCDKQDTLTVTCPGADPCDGNPCDLGNECILYECTPIDETTFTCDESFLDDTNTCTVGGGPSDPPGTCDAAGGCTPDGCTQQPPLAGECFEGDECNLPDTCNLTTFQCVDGGTEADDTPCTGGSCQGGTCQQFVCGNGIVEGTEQCDGDGLGTGGETATCNLNCTTSSCGDGIVNTTAGEECEPPNTATCDATCVRFPPGPVTCACIQDATSCPPVGSEEVTACQTLDILAVDCTIFGSGVPIPVDPVLDPAAVAFAGVALDVQPQATITLPADLTCGFSGVVGFGDVFDGFVTFDVGGTETEVNSYTDPTDPFGQANLISPHGQTTFDFFEACGTRCQTPLPRDPDVPQDGVCMNDTSIACTDITEGVDCVALEGTGPGVVVPFFPRDPPGSDNSADPSATGQISVTPGAPGILITTYNYDGILLPVITEILNVCIGGVCGTISGFVPCPPADRTGPASTATLPDGSDDPGICRNDGFPQVPTDCTAFDAPRIMYDAQCNKLGAAACGGTPCGDVNDCPFGPFGAQACVANLCTPVPPGTPGIPPCCEPYEEYNAVANVCATGQPGTGLADTDSPTLCGDCVPLGCVGSPGNPDIGTCRNGPDDGNDCTSNADCAADADPDVEVLCRIACTSCDNQSCCDLLKTRFLTATPAQFPVLPVNPAP